MHEQLILLYQELEIELKAILANDNISNDEKRKMVEYFETLEARIEELKNDGVEIDLTQTEFKEKLVIDPTDNWEQFIYASTLEDLVVGAMVDQIKPSKESGEGAPTDIEVLTIIKTFEKFHYAHYKPLSKENKEAFLDERDVLERALRRERGHQAVVAAQLLVIESLGTSNWQVSYNDLVNAFEEFKDGERPLPEAIKHLPKAPMPKVTTSLDKEEESDKTGEDGEKEKQESWVLFIENASFDEKISKALISRLKVIAQEIEPEELDTIKIMEVVALIEQYYDKNIDHPSGARVTAAYEKIHGVRMPEQYAKEVEHYRKAAFASILNAIDTKLDRTLTIDPEQDFHQPFDTFFRDASKIPDQANSPIPYQFKYDLKQVSFGEETELGLFKFGKPTIQASVKFGFTKSANAYNSAAPASGTPEVDVTDVEADLVLAMKEYFQLMRTSVNLRDCVKDKMNPTVSTTAFTSGTIVGEVKPFGNLVLKTDILNIKWFDLDEKKEKNERKENNQIDQEKSKFSLGSIRFQLNVDIIKVFDALSDNTLKKLRTYLPVLPQRGMFSISFGCNLSINEDELLKQLRPKKAPTKPSKTPKTKVVKPQVDPKDKEMLEQFTKKFNDLGDEAKKIGDLLENPKQNKNALRNAAQNFKSKVDDVVKKMGSHKWVNEAGKEAAENLLKEGGEHVMKRLGPRALGQIAKLTARAIPVVGLVMTIVDVGFFVYGLVQFFSQDNWQDWFIRKGLWLERNFGFVD